MSSIPALARTSTYWIALLAIDWRCVIAQRRTQLPLHPYGTRSGRCFTISLSK